MLSAVALSIGTAAAVAVLLGLPALRAKRGITDYVRGWLQRPWKRRGSRHRSTAESLREDASGFLRQYAALLQSGRSQSQAWADLHSHWRSRDPTHPLCVLSERASAAEHSGLGAEVGLRRGLQASPSGTAEGSAPVLREVLERLISVHALSQTTGAPLAGLCRKAAESLEDSAALHAAIRTSVAGPQLTQRLLTLLPLGGLAMGAVMGASPLGVLLGTGLGWACLISGLGMLFLGRAWSGRMIRAVARNV